ncbi:MAG: hypothetical protein G3M78_06020 [Candidatus Nitrohelix vancouverensis]|uniref:Calcineurin-like phosphoesterase domain-containing protein n=1 Tax=Candidatus Nitrohelix vancouverensis TaxID=2705534 RepID=A0A7T0G331_9BACT|nr:MAG: hypothetical protein G3M78_06020 [Candidatus Nitrohelix vancouverensis]
MKLLKFSIGICCVLLLSGGASQSFAETDRLKVAIVGDTGIGERAYHPGFVAVQKAMVEQKPDLLIHLGDFAYQPDLFPSTCDSKYIKEIKETLVDPFPERLFVAGDNDLDPHKWKPKASGCWKDIAAMGDSLERNAPREREGLLSIGPVLFGLIDGYPWENPEAWLKPHIDRARAKGQWVILAHHEPALTTAWFLDKQEKELKQIGALAADLVLSGHQHSYERFHPLSLQGDSLIAHKENAPVYPQGVGAMHIVSGGGGATFKPFADMQGHPERSAPPEVFQALAKRALMNHFIILEITKEKIEGTTYQVCTDEGDGNPRWKPRKDFWKEIRLDCDGKTPGTYAFDRFDIKR